MKEWRIVENEGRYAVEERRCWFGRWWGRWHFAQQYYYLGVLTYKTYEEAEAALRDVRSQWRYHQSIWRPVDGQRTEPPR